MTPKRFELLDFTRVKLDHTNSRMQKHNKENVPALDLAMTLTATNHVLGMIHPALRPILFCANGAQGKEPTQAELELPVDDLPNVRFPHFDYPVKYNSMLAGYTLTVDYGRGGEQNLRLKTCDIKTFRIRPIEGGSVEVKFTVQCADGIDERIVGKLSMLQQSEISITLEGPEIVEPANVTPIKRGRKKTTAAEAQQGIADAMEAADKPKGLGTDADQAARQEAVLAADPTMATSAPLAPGGEGWPFPMGEKAAVTH
jgi:hypothetical protein